MQRGAVGRQRQREAGLQLLGGGTLCVVTVGRAESAKHSSVQMPVGPYREARGLGGTVTHTPLVCALWFVGRRSLLPLNQE